MSDTGTQDSVIKLIQEYYLLKTDIEIILWVSAYVCMCVCMCVCVVGDH